MTTIKITDQAVDAVARAIYGPAFDADLRKSENWNVDRDLGDARTKARTALADATPHLDIPYRPRPIDPSALADLPEGTVVYARRHDQHTAFDVLALRDGTWWAPGTTEGFSQKDLIGQDEAIAILRESTDYWVLPTP